MIDPMKHVGLVRSVAHCYRWACGVSLDFEDLVQEGMQGVIRAAETFDPARGAFSTYASPWIRHYVQRAVHMNARTVRVPAPVAKAAHARGEPISLTCASLDAPVRINGHDADGRSVATLGERLGFNMDPEGPKNIDESERRELVAHLLSTLTERQSTVLRLRFFEDLTLFETGRRIGLTKERTRQIQNEALRCIEGRMRREAAE